MTHVQDRVPLVHSRVPGVSDSSCRRPRAGPAEEDLKLLQRGGLAPRPRLAARLRLAEKRVLQGTMDAVRRCGA